MDLEKYRLLMQVIDAGSLSRAAEGSHYTLSGISRVIGGLEKEIGFPLLLRSREGITPTDACRELLPHLRKLLQQEDVVMQKAAQIQGLQVGTVHIGVAYSTYYSMLAAITEAFHEEHPHVIFHFHSGYSSELLQMMDDHQLDLALISYREGAHRWLPLGEEELVAWLPSHHPLTTQKKIPLTTFAEEPYIAVYPGKDIDNHRIFHSYGIKPNHVMSTEDSFAAYSMVEAGLGITMNHRSNAAHWNGTVEIRPLDPPLAIPIGIAYPAEPSPLTSAVLDYLSEHVPPLDGGKRI